MDKQKPVAERIRPILEAMERSIELARSKRRGVHKPNDTPPDEPSGQSGQSPQPQESGTSEVPAGEQAARPRLKARPKRPSNFTGRSNWRSAS